MMRRLLVLLLIAAPLLAQPAPEDCLKSSRVTVTHAGKTYRLATEACRTQFLSDPERYSQLYDALLELEAAGKTIEVPPDEASLVPS